MKKLFVGLTLAVSALSMAGGAPGSPYTEKTIGFIPPGTISPFYAEVIAGAKPACEIRGFKLDVESPQHEDDFQGMLSVVDEVLRRKPLGVCLCSTDGPTLIDAIRKANRAGIPAVVFNSITPLPGAKVFAYVGYDQFEAGRKVARHLKAIARGPLRVCIIEGLPSQFTLEREGGFIEEIKDSAEIVVSQKVRGDWERGMAAKVAAEALARDPGINVFYGLSDEMALGALDAVRKIGKRDVVILGIDGNRSAIQSILEGGMTATLNTNRDLIGKESINSVIKAIRREGSSKIITIETFIIDRGNAHSFY
ncbi:MAG TPA: sugar ABC transporter substrate-binding protein [Spirochaetales bacterium]|nr:sugar ABC transporter substrate-binding protein [Spirochaetales bacterium]HRY54992.1 sugar ABC transporter substrate-binding protein [Spirochaetia bacterium]HRZ65957.1 sugar ABC transporter substrate-binding protein [Spirochaetia bacterium]